MTATTLRLLAWKDLRQHRVALVGAGILLVGPFVVAGIWGWRNGAFSGPGTDLRALIMFAGTWSLMLGIFTGAILGGISFASERQAGSADFLQMMVPNRRILLVSRVLFSVTALLASAGVAAATVLLAAYAGSDPPPDSGSDINRVLGALGGLILCVFGSAWFASCALKSPTISAAIGIAVTAAVGVGVGSGGSMVELTGADTARALAIIGAIVGCLGFFGGCVGFLRRREP